MSGRPNRLVVGGVSLTTGLVMNMHYEGDEVPPPQGEVDQYDHASVVPTTPDGLVIPSSVHGLQMLQQNMQARVPAPVLDVAVQAAFRQIVPPGLRAAILVLTEWDPRWFEGLERPGIYSDAGSTPSRGDQAFQAACAGTMRPRDDGEAARGTLPALAQALRRHAWTLGPLCVAGGNWVGVLVRLTDRDPATGLYGRVAQIALVDPRRDFRHEAAAQRALRRLEHALGQAGLGFGADVRHGTAAWAEAAWRRRGPWVPRQTDPDDGSCGPRYYVLAKTVFTRLTALWEGRSGHGAGEEGPPYDEAALWSAPLSGWFDHEATRWEMVGHHAARAVQHAHYQARVTVEVVRTQHDGLVPARAAMRLPPAPAYEAAPASLFAPGVWPSTARPPPAALCPSSSSDSSGGGSDTDPATNGQKRRRRSSDAATSHPPHKRFRVRASDASAPPTGYPVYPARPLDPWDGRHVRWGLTDSFEARRLNMHAAHWREAAAARARRGDDDGGDEGDGSDGDHDGDSNQENGDGQDSDRGHDQGNTGDPGSDNEEDDGEEAPPDPPRRQQRRRRLLAYIDADGNRRINNQAMEDHVARLMRGE